MKTCFKCKKEKPLDAFYAHPNMADGHLNKCKACTKDDVARRYSDPHFRPRIVAYERKRAKDPGRKAKALLYQIDRRKRSRGKARARYRVSNALRDGLLTKALCLVCGSPKVEAHHSDYRRPLSVVWLCRKHHMLAEGKQPF